MLNFLKLDHLKDTLRRFPLAVVYVVLLTIAFFCFVHSSSQEALFLHLIFILILTFFCSVGVSLFTEKTAYSSVIK